MFFFFLFLFLVTGVGCEIECIGVTGSTDILCVSVRVACRIQLNIKENFKIWMLSFLERSEYLTYNDQFSDKGKIYFEAGAINTDRNT